MIKNILFDFDGVILDSMKIRTDGFREIFSSFQKKDVDLLVDFHNKNGGLSRYVKIEYFFKRILNEDINAQKINEIAARFSEIMRYKLIDKSLLIEPTINFIYKNYKAFNFHIVSGSDQDELRFLCDKLKLREYFISIFGSPTVKDDLVANIIKSHKYKKSETIIIGDSINDFNSAEKNKIKFFGFNNPDLKEKSDKYIENYNLIF